jgi:CRISPR-associated protein Cas1
MRQHQNTLFVTTQKAYLAKEGEAVVVRVDKKTRLRVPIHTIGGIVCFGNVACSPFLMGFCAERDVSISFLTERGRFLARSNGPVSGNVLVRRAQYRRADKPDVSARIAAAIIAAKVANCRSVLQRGIRDHKEKVDVPELKSAVKRLGDSIKELKEGVPLDVLRGIEGNAASIYFNVFDQLIVANKEEFSFKGRNRRPPLDKVNALLSFIYTLLMHDVRSSLEAVGIDPAVGFLHRDRPGRYGMALDLMEEFRPFLADRLTFSLINLGQVKKAGFSISESGAVYMDDETRKVVLTAYQNRKQDEVFHPFFEEKVKIGMLFFSQALLMNRFLRDDLDGYPPFIWR